MADDPYVYLEDSNSEKGMEFALLANRMCLRALGDPMENSATYSRILKSLERDDRIPFVSRLGKDENGNDLLFNLWKDSKNPRGIWRKTTFESYESRSPVWTVVLDLDELSKNENTPWVWRGCRFLPRGRDLESEDGKRATRALINLSEAGSDEVVTREFDLILMRFVEKDAFNLPKGKTQVCYKSRDVLLVGSDVESGSLTHAGYPRTIREWRRGTDISNAPVVFEGEPTDIAVSYYVNDERIRSGGIYEVRSRAISPSATKYWLRRVHYNHLLAEDNPLRAGMVGPSAFQELQIPEDSEIDFVGNLLMVTLRSDWSPEPGKNFIRGSIVNVNAHKFLKYGPADRIYHVLFQPSRRVACENYAVTKNFVILSLLDNLRSRLEFYKLEKDGNKLRMVGSDKNPVIRMAIVRAVDPNENDNFWLTTSGYIEPTTLWLGDATKMDTGDKTVIRKTGSVGYIVRKLKALPAQFDAKDLEVAQKICTSKDGTEIPYFIVKKKGLVLDKSNRTLLYGYGGFDVSVAPHYVGATGIAWLERDGVYVEASIRGGGEFGPTWHEAALRDKRHKAYEDFIAVAEHLISSKICKAKTLAIRGGTNGGLLVANVYLMRPDLFGAVHCAMPVLDLKRLKKMGGGSSWLDELGDPETSDWEEFMKKYSPYHNVDESNKKYPPILLTGDARNPLINPGHARKMVKMLWEKGQGKSWPSYYYENVEGGPMEAERHAFVTTLAYDFLLRSLSKNRKKA